MQGLLKCARYAFSPNKLKYCGPVEKNFQLGSHLIEGVADQGLAELLDDFKVMYPYLKLIADENNLDDPFDEKVVEAYWIGNGLLEKVSLKGFWEELTNKQELKKRFKSKDLKWIMTKVPNGAKVHHSFHVFNIWNRTGHEARSHTVKTMDKCRISWGEVVSKSNGGLGIKTQELKYIEGKLELVDGAVKKIAWRIGDKELIKNLNKGDLVTVHWDWVCEKVDKSQVSNLKYYTEQHLKLANLTI